MSVLTFQSQALNLQRHFKLSDQPDVIEEDLFAVVMKQLLVGLVTDILTLAGVLLDGFEITAAVVLIKVYLFFQFHSKSDHFGQSFQFMEQPIVFTVGNVTVEGFKER